MELLPRMPLPELNRKLTKNESQACVNCSLISYAIIRPVMVEKAEYNIINKLGVDF